MTQLGVDIDLVLKEHAVDAVFRAASGALKQVKVCHSPVSYAEAAAGGLTVAEGSTIAYAKTADVSGVDNRCTLKIGAVEYNIVDAKVYDGTWTIMTLSLD